jgi:6-phosphogluconolactonase (cycloisomerase 2 family)
MKNIGALVLLAALNLTVCGCGGGSSTAAPNGSNPITNATSTNQVPATNPVPMISNLSPDCSPQGEQLLNPFVNGQLLVTGQDFVANSVVRWNGNDRPTTFSGSRQLAAQISASDIAAAGTAAVTVFNPAPDGGSSNISTFTITTGGVGPQAIIVDPTGKFAYVVNEGCGLSALGNVSMYTINPNTGILASVGPPVFTNDEGGRSVAVDPSGKFVYVANSGEGDTAGSVSAYAINPTTGVLASIGTIVAPCAPPPSPGSCSPISVAVDPTDRFAYAANEGGFAPTSLSMYKIDGTTGKLSLIGVIATAGRAIAVTVDPSAKFAYAVDGTNGSPARNDNVSTYSIDASRGALTFIGAISTGSSPTAIAVHPSGNFAYVTNSGSNDVSMYSVNTTTGALISIGTIAGAAGPIAMHPSGKFAYVGNSVYAIDTATGALTLVGTIAGGSSITIHPSGKFAYVTNPASNSVSIYSIDGGNGLLTLIGTVPT